MRKEFWSKWSFKHPLRKAAGWLWLRWPRNAPGEVFLFAVAWNVPLSISKNSKRA